MLNSIHTVLEYKQKHYDLISYLKGYSIFTIVLMHLIQIFLPILPNFIKSCATIGGSGVHVFFLCSGFGLFLSQSKSKKTYVEFLKRRFLKIYVPYVLIISITFIASFFTNKIYTGENVYVAYLSHIFLFKMFSPMYESSFGTQFWYISTLFQFYLLFIPLFNLQKKIGAKKYLFLCSVFSVIWWITMYVTQLEEIKIYGSFFLQYLWEFALGMFLAEYVLNNNTIKIKNMTLLILAIIGIIITTISTFKGGLLKSFNDLSSLTGYLSLAIFIYFNLKQVSALFIKISSISYEWYLSHMLVFSIIFTIFDFNNYYQLLIGIISFYISIIFAKEFKKICLKIS